VVPLAFPPCGKQKKKKKIKAKTGEPVKSCEGIGSNDALTEKSIPEDSCATVEDNEEINIEAESSRELSSTQDKESFSRETDIHPPPKMTATSSAAESKVRASYTSVSVSGLSLAAQMMAGLSSLKSQAEKQREALAQKYAMEEEAKLAEKMRQDDEEQKQRTSYVPTNPAILKTAATLGLSSEHSDMTSASNWRVLPINRPDEIKSSRYDLPVSAMEYEIVDSVRNHFVTIICSETGSGKYCVFDGARAN